MKDDFLTQQDIMEHLRASLEPCHFILALWEAGAAGFNRIDEWSDIDLYIVSEDERIEDTIESFDSALMTLSEIELRYRLPEPTWHGHSQIFCRLKKTSPFLFIDVVFMKKSSKDKFLQYDIHGKPRIYFDKGGIVRDDPLDKEMFIRKLKARLEELKTTFSLFQVLTLKELNRGNGIEALVYYMGATYRPLVEILRIKYAPFHYNFYGRYVYYELPGDVVRRLENLAYALGPDDLRKKYEEAGRWFLEIASSIRDEELKQRLGMG
jgi:predicted nucleotidyltransferase